MRGLIPGLDSPRPVMEALPGIFQEDDLLRDLLAAFDDSLAPVFATLDNLAASFDPRVAPADFVDWLARWVGLAIDQDWTLERRRELVARTVELYRWRGTVRGLREAVALHTGAEPEIVEHGGVAWSAEPSGAVPGSPNPRVTVRVRPPPEGELDLARLNALVDAAKPAHLAHTIEIAP